jgi:beta-lactamase regulating signal transducer with metallopeptidase domain
MPAFLSSLTVLGWSLLDSIWQMAVLWIAYTLLTAGSKRISPAGKYNLIVLFVFISAEWFVYTFLKLLNEPAKAFLPGFIPISSLTNQWILWFSSGYLLILFVRLLQYINHQYFQRSNQTAKLPAPEWQAIADRYARLLGIRRRVQVYLCEVAETAETSRFIKPLILIPVSLITQLSTLQLEAILVHELYHIRRNDYLINICLSCFRSIFFFNPFAQLFYKALAKEREMACDEGVLQWGFASDLYAETLYALEKFRQPQPGFSLAADGNKPWLLMERIRRVLGKPESPKRRFHSFIIFSGLLALVLALFKPEMNVSSRLSVAKKDNDILNNRSALMPARYEGKTEVSAGKVKEKGPRTNDLPKLMKKRILHEDQLIIEPEPTEDPDADIQTYFAENYIAHDYSNQPAVELSQDPVIASPGMPYVPSISLSYDAQPVIVAADSLREVVVNNEKKEIHRLSNLKTIASLRELEIQIENNNQEINRIDLQNKKRILPVQENIKPLLMKIQRQINIRKKEINRLKTRLEVSEEEIIHI